MSNILSLRYGYRGRTDCSYWDYYVDDQRLAELLRLGDFIPPFGWLDQVQEKRFAGMLLRKRASDVGGGGVPLFVCPECADYDCGVLHCKVQRVDDLILWSEFTMGSAQPSPLTYRFQVGAYFQLFQPFWLGQGCRPGPE